MWDSNPSQSDITRARLSANRKTSCAVKSWCTEQLGKHVPVERGLTGILQLGKMAIAYDGPVPFHIPPPVRLKSLMSEIANLIPPGAYCLNPLKGAGSQKQSGSLAHDFP
jgi:hypothetical protein